MRVLVALDDAGRFASRLRAVGIEVVATITPQGVGRSAAGATLEEDLARADVLVLPAEREVLTPALVALCDRVDTRIVARYRRDLDRRLAQSLGVATVSDESDPVVAVNAVPEPQAAPARGRAIAVWGPAGAPGRTTVSIELARELARDGRRVGLADADTHAPSVAIALGVADEGPGLAAACRQAGRGELTPAELTRIAVPLGDVEVLPGINRPARWPELSADRLARAVDAARDWVDDLVVDVAASLERDEEIVSDLDGPRRNAATLAALSSADLVVAVVAADPVGVSRFLRSYPDLRATVGSTPVRVIVNKLRGGALGVDARGQVRRSLERYAGIDRCWFVPWDPRAADAALLTARPIGEVAARGAIPAAVRRFVGEAVSPPPRPPAPVRRSRADGRRRGATPHAVVTATAP